MAQYGDLKREIVEIKRKIGKLKEQKEVFINDMVTTSAATSPYQKQIIYIRGYNKATKSRLDNIQSLQETLNDRETDIEMRLDEIENFIISLNDSRARQIIEYKYVDGLTWAAAASKLYGYPCADRARMYLKKYLKNFN